MVCNSKRFRTLRFSVYCSLSSDSKRSALRCCWKWQNALSQSPGGESARARELRAARTNSGGSPGSVAISARDPPPFAEPQRSRGIGTRLRLSRHAVDRLGTEVEERHRSGFSDRAGVANTGKIHLPSRENRRNAAKSRKRNCGRGHAHLGVGTHG